MLTRRILAAATITIAAVAVAPAASASEPHGAPLVQTQEAAAAGSKVWFAFMWPDSMKPQLEEKKMLLTFVGFLPFGSVWGPIALLGQSFDLEWALPSIIFCVLGGMTWWTAGLGWLGFNWIATQTMFANLNRADITVGGGEAMVK